MIYLDHAATTNVLPEALEFVMDWLDPQKVGNPSSLHKNGKAVREKIEEARESVAKLIGANPDEIYFTSGGTESNWLCIAQSADTCTIKTTPLEHESVLYSVEASTLLNEKTIPVRPSGEVDLDGLEEILSNQECKPDLISVMWVNNELGTINPIIDIARLCEKYNVLLHTDAVQAVGHLPINVKACGVDMLSLSGHKFGAFSGVGAAYIANHVRMEPFVYGSQERGVRGGTENVPGILSLGVAARMTTELIQYLREHYRQLRDTLLLYLKENMSIPYYINGGDNVLESIVSLTIPGVHSEALMALLNKEGICVSAGAACSASSKAPSHVLTGIGLSEEDAASTIRISFGRRTSPLEVFKAADSICRNSALIKSL